MADSDPDPGLAAVQALLAAGSEVEADRLLQQLIAQAPHAAALWRERSWIALRRGDVAGASDLAGEAFRLDPTDVGTLNALASCALQSQLPSQAAELARLALEIAPGDLLAGMIRATALSLQGRFADAFEVADRLPETGEVRIIRAEILASAGVIPQALSMVEAGLELAAGNEDARLLRASLLQTLVHHEAALEELAGILERNPDHSRALWLRGMSRVALGDWGGYADMEARLEASGHYQPPAGLTQPAWRPPADLAGRSIVVHCEQGLGDTVQFCRLASRLADRGAEVHLMVRTPLMRLMQSLPGMASLTRVGDPPPAADYRVSVMSLPALLEVDGDALTPFAPYLAADPELKAAWAERLRTIRAASSRPLLGLVWSGGVHPDRPETYAMNARRNIPLDTLVPLLTQDVTFIGLQVGAEAEAEHEAFCAANPALAFPNLGPELSDLADTAAVISSLDLVIAVDTSVVHVAGALGARTWMLNRRDSCWRWMQSGTDTPWYPSLTQFRQSGDRWEPVVEAVVGALAEAFDLRGTDPPTGPDLSERLAGIVASLQTGDLDGAEALDRAAVSQAPTSAAARNALAHCLIQRRAFAAAQAEAAHAVRLDPTLAAAHNHLGQALNGLGQPDAAAEAFGRALQLSPRELDYGLNLAHALETAGRLDAALDCVEGLRRVYPAATAVYLLRADLLEKLQRYPEALESYETAIALDPDNPMAHWWYSLCLLLTGRHAEGWREFEWRLQGLKLGPPVRPRSMPLWRGEDLTGRTILVHAEQGFGDAIQFARYVPLLQQAGARVIVEAFPPLVELFETLAGHPTVVPVGSPAPDADYHCPFMSLPFALQSRHPDIPAEVPYLSVPTRVAARWAARFPPSGDLRIGLVCSGRPTHPNDANRSLPLEVLADALPPGPRYVLLQQELRDTDRAVLRRRPDIVSLTDDLKDFSDTAAACAQMDLVISVDTSVAHLAGALARPLLILLPFQPEWRWGLASEACPWYPTARLLRQTGRGDWSAPLAAVTAAVEARLSDDTTTP